MKQILKLSSDFCKTHKNMGMSLFLLLLPMVFSHFSFKFIIIFIAQNLQVFLM